VRCKDGRLVYGLLNTSFIIRDNVPMGAVVVAHDITERRRLEKAIHWNSERMRILSNVASQLLSTEKPQEIIEKLCHEVMTFLGCDSFFNYLVDERQKHLHLNSYAGIPAETAQEIEWLDFGAAMCGCVARDSCRIIVENIPESLDPRTELVKSFGIKAYACSPLMSEGKVIGTLSFGTRSRTTFSEDELSMMQAVADQVASALSRVKLDEELRQLNAELEHRIDERTAELKAASLYSRILLESSLDPLFTISPEGKITDVNEATEFATGLTRRKLIGTDFADYFTDPDGAKVGYMTVLAKGDVRDYPMTIRHIS
jgi:GAF domain-containing protein